LIRAKFRKSNSTPPIDWRSSCRIDHSKSILTSLKPTIDWSSSDGTNSMPVGQRIQSREYYSCILLVLNLKHQTSDFDLSSHWHFATRFISAQYQHSSLSVSVHFLPSSPVPFTCRISIAMAALQARQSSTPKLPVQDACIYPPTHPPHPHQLHPTHHTYAG